MGKYAREHRTEFFLTAIFKKSNLHFQRIFQFFNFNGCKRTNQITAAVSSGVSSFVLSECWTGYWIIPMPWAFYKKHGGCHSRVYKAMRECVGQASKTAINSYGGSQLFASPHIAFAQKLQLGVNNKYRPQRNRRIVNALVCLLNGYLYILSENVRQTRTNYAHQP